MKLGMRMMPPPGRDIRGSLRGDREAMLPADRPSQSEAYAGEHAEDAAIG